MRIRKIICLALLLGCVICLSSALVACKKNQNDSALVESEIVHLDTLTLTVGGEYELVTGYEKDYKISYSSSDASICTVNESGVIKAIALGTAKIEVTMGNYKDYLTVVVGKSAESNVQTDYQVSFSKPDKMYVGTEITIKPIVYKQGIVVDEKVSFTFVENDDVLSQTQTNEGVKFFALKKGKTTIKAVIGTYESVFNIKVYDESNILPCPAKTIEKTSVSWTKVEEAVGYHVTLDGGNSWTTVDNNTFSYSIDGVVNPINVDIVAIADVNSDKVDSLSLANKSYSFTQEQVRNSIDNTILTVAEESGETVYVIKATSNVKAINVFGETKALLQTTGEVDFYSQTTITFDVKGTANSVKFISENAEGTTTYSEFVVGAEYDKVGYTMNGYGTKCYVVADGNITVKNVEVSYVVDEFATSSVYNDTVNGLQNMDINKISQGLKNLAPVEKEKLSIFCADELKKYEEFVLPTFCGKKYTATDIVSKEKGILQVNIIDLYNGKATIDFVKNVKSNANNPTGRFSLANLVEGLNYDEYEIELLFNVDYRHIDFCGKKYASEPSKQGKWHTITLTKEALIKSTAFCFFNTVEYGQAAIRIGSVIGKNVYPNATFCGTEYTSANLTKTGAINFAVLKDNNINAYNGKATIDITGQTNYGNQEVTVSFASLITEEMTYKTYTVEIYMSYSAAELWGTTEFRNTLNQWITITVSANDMKTKGIYFYIAHSGQGMIPLCRIGSVTGNM